MGSLYQPGGLIFATETGTIINPSNLRNLTSRPSSAARSRLSGRRR
jgi:integrase